MKYDSKGNDVSAERDRQRAEDFANISFQMGLATGHLIKEGATAMPLDWVYRIMSGVKFAEIEADL